MSLMLNVGKAQSADKDELFAVLIDDNSTFNLPVLQKLLGGIKAESAKQWAREHSLDAIKGNRWVFTGRQLRLAVERALEEQK